MYLAATVGKPAVVCNWIILVWCNEHDHLCTQGKRCRFLFENGQLNLTKLFMLEELNREQVHILLNFKSRLH